LGLHGVHRACNYHHIRAGERGHDGGHVAGRQQLCAGL
jgi:hypothetical protein